MNGASDADFMTGTLSLDGGHCGEGGFKCPRVEIAEHGKDQAELLLFIEGIEICGEKLIDTAVVGWRTW